MLLWITVSLKCNIEHTQSGQQGAANIYKFVFNPTGLPTFWEYCFFVFMCDRGGERERH